MKPCLFNRTLAQFRGKNCAKQIDTEPFANGIEIKYKNILFQICM